MAYGFARNNDKKFMTAVNKRWSELNKLPSDSIKRMHDKHYKFHKYPPVLSRRERNDLTIDILEHEFK